MRGRTAPAPNCALCCALSAKSKVTKFCAMLPTNVTLFLMHTVHTLVCGRGPTLTRPSGHSNDWPRAAGDNKMMIDNHYAALFGRATSCGPTTPLDTLARPSDTWPRRKWRTQSDPAGRQALGLVAFCRGVGRVWPPGELIS